MSHNDLNITSEELPDYIEFLESLVKWEDPKDVPKTIQELNLMRNIQLSYEQLKETEEQKYKISCLSY